MLWPAARLQLLAWTSPRRSHCPLTTPCCPSRTVVSVWGVSDPSLRGLEEEKCVPERNHRDIHANVELPMTECLLLKHKPVAVFLSFC